MSDKKILEKAIRKAVDGGWKPELYEDTDRIEAFVLNDCKTINFGHVIRGRVYLCGMDVRSLNDVIFNHDFAKALWGEQEKCSTVEERDKGIKVNAKPCDGLYVLRKLGWKRHLQQMVTSDDPIKYLGDNI